MHPIFNITFDSISSFDDCHGFEVSNFQFSLQAQTTKGVQVVDCSDGFIYSYFISEYCNPTGTHIEGSSNIKLYSGTNNAYGISDFFVFSLLTLVPGCTTDVDDVVGILILGSSDILLSKVNSINYKGTPFPCVPLRYLHSPRAKCGDRNSGGRLEIYRNFQKYYPGGNKRVWFKYLQEIH